MTFAEKLSYIKPALEIIYQDYVQKGILEEFNLEEPEVPSDPQSLEDYIKKTKSIVYYAAEKGYEEGVKLKTNTFSYVGSLPYQKENSHDTVFGHLNIQGICTIKVERIEDYLENEDGELIPTISETQEFTINSPSEIADCYISFNATKNVEAIFTIQGIITYIASGSSNNGANTAHVPNPKILEVIQYPFSINNIIPKDMFYFQDLRVLKFNFPSNIDTFGTESCRLAFLDGLIIPKQIKTIQARTFYNSGRTYSSLDDIIEFEHSEDDEIVIEEKAFESKNAANYTIKTDNSTIKNYNWAGDNVTPILLHRDGTPWEEETNASS